MTIEKALRETLGLTNEWLRFAEAKNGVLIALSGVAVGAYVKGMGDAVDYPAVRVFLVIAAVFTLGSIAVAIAAFVPTLRSIRQLDNPARELNPLFFGDAACFSSATEYVIAMRRMYGYGHDDIVPVEVALADQIVTNARIATLKYRYFRAAMYLFVTGLFTIAGAVLMYVLERLSRQPASRYP